MAPGERAPHSLAGGRLSGRACHHDSTPDGAIGARRLDGVGCVCRAGIVLLALDYRLLGAVLYLHLGHAGGLMFVTLRGVFAVAFIALAFVFPPTGLLVLALDCFSAGAPRSGNSAQFFLIHVVAAVILAGLLFHAISRVRSRTVST